MAGSSNAGYKPAKFIVAPPSMKGINAPETVIGASVAVPKNAKFAADKQGKRFPTHAGMQITGAPFEYVTIED